MVLKKRSIVRSGKLMQLRSKTYPDSIPIAQLGCGFRKHFKARELGVLAIVCSV